jgi:predicted dehydrogenase
MTYWKHLDEAKNVVAAIRDHKRVMQVGTNGLSDTKYDAARQRVRTGVLGKHIHAQASDVRNGPISLYSPKTYDPDAVPGKSLDWEAWLGNAEKRAYEPGRFFAFRSYWEYSGGVATDFFPHLLTPLIYVMDLKFPQRVAATGGRYFWDDGREIPDTFTLSIEYPDGPSLTLLAGLANNTNWDMLIRGQQATLTFGGIGAYIDAQTAAGNKNPREVVRRKEGGSVKNHWKDFINCIKTRDKPRSNELLGYYVMTALHMGVRSYREGKVFAFDEKTETVTAAG